MATTKDNTKKLEEAHEVKLPEGVTKDDVDFLNGQWMPALIGDKYEAACEDCGAIMEVRGGVRPRFCCYCGSAIPEQQAHKPDNSLDAIVLLDALGNLLQEKQGQWDVMNLLRERGWRA